MKLFKDNKIMQHHRVRSHKSETCLLPHKKRMRLIQIQHRQECDTASSEPLSDPVNGLPFVKSKKPWISF